MPSAMPRHPRFTDLFSPLELASFFAQHQAAVDVSLDRPSFCFFRVWLRFLLFLFRTRMSVPLSRTGCRLRPNFLPSWSLPSVHPNISTNLSHSPRRRNRAQRVRSLSSLRLARCRRRGGGLIGPLPAVSASKFPKNRSDRRRHTPCFSMQQVRAERAAFADSNLAFASRRRSRSVC
jgi:hypothetical protein